MAKRKGKEKGAILKHGRGRKGGWKIRKKLGWSERVLCETTTDGEMGKEGHYLVWE